MSIGAGWPQLGAITKDQAFELLDSFESAGGNYIDTANGYQAEESEIWIGEWLAKRGECGCDPFPSILACVLLMCPGRQPR